MASNWTFIGKKPILCPHCGAEVECEVRIRQSEKPKGKR